MVRHLVTSWNFSISFCSHQPPKQEDWKLKYCKAFIKAPFPPLNEVKVWFSERYPTPKSSPLPTHTLNCLKTSFLRRICGHFIQNDLPHRHKLTSYGKLCLPRWHPAGRSNLLRIKIHTLFEYAPPKQKNTNKQHICTNLKLSKY